MRLSLHKPSSLRAGFSLLEITVAIGISGILFGGIWQLTSVVGQQKEAAGIVSQATTVTAAAQNYIGEKRATLLALSQLSTLNSVARIKIMSTDTGHTADSVQSSGHLPQGFVNLNSYGQTYVLYVRRQDGGTIGAVDNNDTLVGLLLTNGGSVIPDAQGAKIASAMGAAGGFMYAANNPAPPAAATRAQGANGGWAVDFSLAGWSSIGTMAQAGRLAVFVSLLPSGGTGSAVGPSTIDQLDDASTEYTSLYNMYVGRDAGASNTTGGNNTAFGYEAQQYAVSAAALANNTAFGYRAMRGNGTSMNSTGTDNVAFGAFALEKYTIGSRNTAVGVYADNNNTADSDRTTVGYRAGFNCTGADVTFVGSFTGACEGGIANATGSTITGAQTGRAAAGPYNSLAGAYIGSASGHTGSYNSAVGYQALNNISATGTYNTAMGYQAGANITDGDYNIMIGANTIAADPAGSYQLNIGNFIYGNMTTGQVSLGSPTMVSGVTLDVSARTDSVRPAVGTSAQRPSCSAALLGSMRFNSDSRAFEYCTSTGWISAMTGSGEAAPPIPALTHGYFVLTSTTYNGNLGGRAGADSICLNDLTANDWMGKADAVSRGLLSADKIVPLLSFTSGYGNLMPVTQYFFARSGQPATGGGDFTTDWAGQAPGWPNPWSGYNYFNGAADYWIGSRGYTANTFGVDGCCNSYCSNWTNGTNSESSGTGSAAGYGYLRYTGSASCDSQRYLICIVNP